MAETTEVEAVNDRLAARELPSMINTPELLEEHKRVNGTKVRTRFPPEPNGYLHVGHAKSMNMNFELAFEKLGVAKEDRETIFRYDDTNPEAESDEYIQSLREDVEWMGWKPTRVTYTSEYFDKLYELAVELIKRDKAFICHQSKVEIEACREVSRAKIANPAAPGDPNSPWRNRPIEESLREFENMRKGKYAANEATLRMKMNMLSPNPNMWDQVAYRIKYMPHPHIGDKWCIYPTYDYTHCIIDSLEHIDYSICTLEFETRRESYFWVLEALDLYRPKVYEMSRLNISYTVLSKRKLLKLVVSGYLRGWDDPRMPTIKGLRRRGYNAAIMNTFCNEIGVTRNMNIVQYERLAAVARGVLHETAPRVMAVINPVLVVLTNFDDIFPSNKGELKEEINIFDYPFDLIRGGNYTLKVEKNVFVDRKDLRSDASDEDFFGLAPGRVVGLKYAFRVVCDEVEVDSVTGGIKMAKCRVLREEDMAGVKPKTAIQWVAQSTSLPIEVRLYSHLFTIDAPHDDTWEEELNPTSEIVVTEAVADKSILRVANRVEGHVQFERVGFFVIDRDSVLTNDAETTKLVFNLTVSLKEAPSNATTGNPSAPGKSRKAEQMKADAERLTRMAIPASEYFKTQTDLYSAWDEEGVPTHDEKGEKLSKNGLKKAKKEWEKQKALYDSAHGTAAEAKK